MAWHYDSPSVVVWNGTRYVLWDPGGDGDCLFNSLAFLLHFYRIDENKTQATLRGFAADGLALCIPVLPPVWFDEHNYEKPNQAKVDKVRDTIGSGYWGDPTCILAILATKYPGWACQILDTANDDEHEVEAATVLSVPKAGDMHLLYTGNSHYIALVLEQDLAGQPLPVPVPPPSSEVLIQTAETGSLKLDVKLSTTNSLSSGINTSSKASEAVIEIHHINVGQGDATLIQIKGADGIYKKSILIDAGRSQVPVRSYLYSLISRKAFRKIDLFVASHYDVDHIGGAPGILTDGDFVQDGLVIYDTGEPVYDATGYSGKGNYSDTFGPAQQGKRQMPDLFVPIVDNCEGVTIRCVALLGFVPESNDNYYFTASRETFHKSLIDGTASRLEINDSGLDSVYGAVGPNECSIGLLLQFGEFHYYTAGDLEKETEVGVAEWIFEDIEQKHLCACKLGHHGSHESTRPEFLQLLRPRLGVVSSGNDKSYGHPSQILIDRFNQLHQSGGEKACLYVIPDVTKVHTGKGISWGTLKQAQDKNGQGSVLLTVTQSQAGRHAFTVRTTKEPKALEITCGERDYDKDLQIVDALKSRPRSGQFLKSRDERREKRKREEEEGEAETLKQIRQKLDETIKPILYRNFPKATVDQLYMEVKRGFQDLATDIHEAVGDEGWEKKVTSISAQLGRAIKGLASAKAVLAYLKERVSGK